MAEMRKRTSMSVLEMGRMLGLGKTESYWLIKKNYFKTILVGNTMRVMIDSFEEWYVHGGVVFQLADEHDAEDGGGNVDGAEVPLQALHSGGFVQVPNQQNSAACSLRYLSQPHEGTSHLES